MNRAKPSIEKLAAALLAGLAATGATRLSAADWPMWRCDAARTATSPEALPGTLHLRWTRDHPPLKPAFWQVRQERLQFDLGYEPVVTGKTLFIASSRNDSVTALDTETGAQRWRFYTDGPVRLAPAAADGRLYFGSDDGCLYCLDADSGKLQWKVRAAPSNRRILGNGRLISVWPARGGPVTDGDRVFFAAGIWPFEGIFVHALDARTGESAWINDRCGFMYATHPHAALSFGGPSPQGCLLLHRGRLVMPSSRAFPATLDPATGRMLQFDFGHGGHGSRPGGWFLATDRDGELCVDPEINAEMHDVGQQVIGQAGIKREPGEILPRAVTVGGESYRIEAGAADSMRAGGKEYRFRDGFPGVEGRIHTMLAADGKLFVVTRSGRLHCFGPQPGDAARHPRETTPLDPPRDAWTARATAALGLAPCDEGYALLFGLGTGRLAEELVLQSKLHLVAFDPDAQRVDAFRRRLDAAGLYGDRAAAQTGAPLDGGLPPFFASLIVCEDLGAAGFSAGEKWLEAVYSSLRPYGGVLCLPATGPQHEAITAWIKHPALAQAKLRREAGFTLVIRAGPLPGAADYDGRANYDRLVKAPMGLLWFGDTAHHHKLFYQGYTHEAGRGLPGYITVADGVMSYLASEQPIDPKTESMTYTDFLQHVNTQPYVKVHTDVYTGRAMPPADARKPAAPAGPQANEPPPLARRNPITGSEESREFLKTYGCDQVGADYGNIITMRSGTAAFYDKRSESGTINISGTRSGCRNNIVPACGVLSLPAWTGNCTCNYPIFTSLALAPMPPQFEQWSAWGEIPADAPIQRAGINFGAPGDRIADDGTLWLEWPSVGGPSPGVRVRVTPDDSAPFYRHSLWMQGGTGWPWVFASGIQGVRSVQIDTIARNTNAPTGRFSVRWTGKVESPLDEEYTFHARSDGPMRAWLGNRPLLDSTMKALREGGRDASAAVRLKAGTKYDLLVDYRHVSGAATPTFAELSWSSPSTPRAAIPPAQLFAPDGGAGLAAAYYKTDRLTGPAFFQRDPQVRFDWGSEPPAVLAQGRAPVRAAERAYTVRLIFAETEPLRAGDRVFSVKLQGNECLANFDVLKEAGGTRRGVIREFRGIRARETIDAEFLPLTEKPPLICGIELIAE